MLFRDIVAGRREVARGNRENRPLVSVVMPTFRRNAEGLLSRAIESALAQSFPDFELIIIDDGSTDGSEETVLRYANKDARIRYYRHDRNSGLPAVRTNEGIMLARGDAIAFLFDDNVFAPDFLECAHATLSATDADAVFANVLMRDKNGDFLLGDWPLDLRLLRNINTVPNGGVVCRRDFFDRFGLYDPHLVLRRTCDWDLWLRALSLGAKMLHMDMTGATEHGLISPNSLGNTVPMALAVSHAYQLDEKRYVARTTALRPSTINNYDVLDLMAITPYVTSVAEWELLVADLYEPFLATHPEFSEAFYSLTNSQLIDALIEDVPSGHPLFKPRKRVLVVSNLADEWTMKWVRGIAGQAGYIATVCPEWVLGAYAFAHLDLVVLISPTARYLTDIVKQMAARGVPIVWCDRPTSKLQGEGQLDLSNMPQVQKTLGQVYFPEPNAPRTFDEQRSADDLRRLISTHAPSSTLDNSEKTAAFLTTISMWRSFSQRSGIFRRPRALIALHSQLLSGSEKYGLLVAQQLYEAGFDVDVAVPESNIYLLNDRAINDWLRSHQMAPALALSYDSSLPARLAAASYDLVFCSTVAASVINAIPPKAVAIAALFSPIAYTPSQLAQVARRVDAWCTDAQWTHDLLRPMIHTPSAVVRPYIEVAGTYKDADNGSDRTVAIAIAGTIQPRKGQLDAIKAVRLLRDRGIHVRLNLYGYALPMLDRYLEEIGAYVEQNGLTDRVSLLGFREPAEIVRDNDIALSASTDESLPQGILDLIRGGLIPVAPAVGGMREVVQHDITGLLYTGRGPERIAGAIASALERKSRWPQFQAAGQQLLNREYSALAMRTGLLNLITSTVEVSGALWQAADDLLAAKLPIVSAMAAPTAVRYSFIYWNFLRPLSPPRRFARFIGLTRLTGAMGLNPILKRVGRRSFLKYLPDEGTVSSHTAVA